MSRKFIAALYLCLASVYLTAQPTDTARLLSQQEFFNWVLEHHPVAQRAQLLMWEAASTEQMARGGFDPKLFADMQQKSFDGKEYFFIGETGFKIPTWFGLELKGTFQVTDGVFLDPASSLPDAGQAVAGVKASLLQGMFIDERRAALEQAKLLERYNEAARREQLNDLLMEAAKSYWDWTVAYNQLQVFQRVLVNAEQRFNAITQRHLRGDLPAVDTLEAMILVQTRQFDLNEAQVAYRNATLQLSNYLWLEGQVPLEISDNLRPPRFTELNDFLSPPLQRYLELIALQHPALRQFQVKMEQLDVDRRLASEMLKPQLNVEYNFLGDGFNFGADNSEGGSGFSQLFTENYKWGLEFRFPLFLRKERGKLELTKIKIMDTDFKLQQKNLELSNKVRQYYNDLQNNRNQILLSEDMVNNYQRLLEAELRKFDLGESSIFLINSREQKLIEAQLKLAKMQGLFRKNRVMVEWAAGVLGE